VREQGTVAAGGNGGDVVDEQRRRVGGIGSRGILGGALVVFLVVVWAAWWVWDSRRSTSGPVTQEPSEVARTERSAQVEEPSDLSDSSINGAGNRWAEWLGTAPAWPADLSQPADCAEVDAMVGHLCRELDRRGGAVPGESPEQICAALAEAAERLAARPPRPTSELASYEALISNVFHVSRVLGRGRAERLRDLLRENDDVAEAMAFAAYRWLAARERCAPDGETAVGMASMYDYAGFLFETIGGQAYLRRRSPRIEALISFYALTVLDRAVESGHNPHGVDPRDDVERARRLFDAQDLLFVDEYRSELDSMAARWERRSGSR
jgi:hypothetical protein